MLELYLVRHGETEHNVKGVYYGWTDCGLTEKGIEQCKALANTLKCISFDAVISSSLIRAAVTAEIICGSNENIIFDDRLRERNFGRWEGLHYSELQSNYKEQWDIWCNDWKNAIIPEGESFSELYSRVEECIEEILAKYKEGKVLVVTHHGCLRLIMVILLRLDANAFWSFVFEHGKYSLLQVDNSRCIVKKINCGEIK
ncbi:MAG: alpha-ribazole phosphatase [Bacillota bacterium]